MICHMIDRLKLAQIPDKIILCTSTLPQDDPLLEIANEEDIYCYRGHPDDVLLRLTQAAEEYEVDTVFNCTADNPFVDAVYIDRLLDFHTTFGNDYSTCRGLPHGTFGWAISHNAMKRACKIKDEIDTEVWGGYFTETGLFRWSELEADPDVNWPQLRLTVDTPEDFELVTRIFDELNGYGMVFPLCDIVDLCRNRPDLVAINANIVQKTPLPIKLKEESGEEKSSGSGITEDKSECPLPMPT